VGEVEDLGAHLRSGLPRLTLRNVTAGAAAGFFGVLALMGLFLELMHRTSTRFGERTLLWRAPKRTLRVLQGVLLLLAVYGLVIVVRG
jgi:hypothetical protein